MNNLSYQLVLVGALSITCQYLAYRIRVPAILPLLISGILVGPVFGILDADALFGDLLFPIVSLAVAIILFEGALTLKLSDLSGHGKVVHNLCTLGVAVTWLSVGLAAHYFLQLSWQIAVLFSALVTVTGPTVIAPILRTVRPSPRVANILRWEGIVIDPIGALLAVVVFEFVIASHNPLGHTLSAFALAVASGLSIGGLLGYGLGVALRHNWLPPYLINIAVLTLVLTGFALSNSLAHESGLLTVTIAGIILANMRGVEIEEVAEFKENLSVLLISGLFILLASRIELNSITALGSGVVALLAIILFIARPLSVLVSSIGSGLRWQEIALLSWIAPRGIVAAAVSALFALQMEAQGYSEAALLVPLVFLVIVVTVVLQSLTSSHLARLLGEQSATASGVFIFGSNEFARMFARELQAHEIPVLVADTNWAAIRNARMEGIPCYFGNPTSSHADKILDLNPFANLLVISPYRQINPVVTYHFQNLLGKSAVYGLTETDLDPGSSRSHAAHYQHSLTLFAEGISYAKLASLTAQGATIKTTRLSESFTDQDYQTTYGNSALRLGAIDKQGDLHLYTTQSEFQPEAGWQIISLVTRSPHLQ